MTKWSYVIWIALLLIGCSNRHLDGSYQAREDSLRADPMIREANCYRQSDGTIITTVVPHTVPIVGQSEPAVEEMRNYIEDSRFWNKRVQKILVRAKDNIVLVQKEGVPLLLGEASNYEAKLHKLRAFYENELTSDTLYRELDARYRGQVVARK